MEKEFEIELQDEAAQEETGVQLPMNFLRFGEVQNDDVKVYIKQDVYKALEKLAASDTSKELGSILLGQYCQEHGKTHVIISKHIEAKYTDASAATLTFTHETWEYIHAEHEKKYPDLKIIGWQHTHPNYGIFLSNYDMFIQENFFNLPFQVAYVIDPVQNLRGFFQWKNDRIEKLKGYYIYDEGNKPIKIEQTRVKKGSPDNGRRYAVAYILLALLFVLTVIQGFSTHSLSQKYEKLQAQLTEEVTRQEEAVLRYENELRNRDALLGDQADTIAQQESSIALLQELLIARILDPSGRAAAEQLIAALEGGTLSVETQADVVAQLNALLAEAETPVDEPEFIAYSVVPGDTLANICAAHGIDYTANIQSIMQMNGIANPSLIYVGQVILLPRSEKS